VAPVSRYRRALARRVGALAAGAALASACAGAQPARRAPAAGRSVTVPPLSDAAVDRAGERITAAGLMRRIRDLADDSMLGRGPGQRGDTLTVDYLAREFARVGLAPGGAYGYRQPVRLLRASAAADVRVRAGDSVLRLVPDSQLAVTAPRAGAQRLANPHAVWRFPAGEVVGSRHNRRPVSGAV
jgi:hypothetical protein